MPIDSGIYRGLNIPDPMGLANTLDLYQNAKNEKVDRANKLAQLAQQQEMQGYKLNEARRSESSIPQQIADSQQERLDKSQEREANYMRGVSAEIANNPQNMDAILQKHAAQAPALGINPEHITWLAQDLSTSQSPEEMQTKAWMHSLTQKEQADYQTKLKLEQAKLEVPKTNPHVIETDKGQVVVDLNKPENIGKNFGAKPRTEGTTLVIGDDGKVHLTTKTDAINRKLNVVSGSGVEKPLTEYQGKSLAFGSRAQDADKILNEVGSEYSPLATNTAGAVENVPGIGYLANQLLSDKDQKIMQAQRNFVNATLRQESGAVINPSEFANAAKQYFPQPGDKPDVIRQKALNRQRVIQTFKVSAGKGANQFDTPLNENVPNINSNGWGIERVN